jgi:hypothetical protein
VVKNIRFVKILVIFFAASWLAPLHARYVVDSPEEDERQTEYEEVSPCDGKIGFEQLLCRIFTPDGPQDRSTKPPSYFWWDTGVGNDSVDQAGGDEDAKTEGDFCLFCSMHSMRSDNHIDLSTIDTGEPHPDSVVFKDHEVAQADTDTRSPVFLRSYNLSYADQLQRKMSVGLSAGKNLCWRAVYNILDAANLVDPSRCPLTQDYAVNAGRDLAKCGFKNDMSACNRPGVVRVYSGHYPGFGKHMTGDYAGHIEILGTDGFFHHFTTSPDDIHDSMVRRHLGDRRTLTQCLVKE